MAYNLRRRSFINQLVDTEDQEANDRASSDEEDHVSEDDESGSGDDYAPSDSSEQSEESDNEYENASLDQRLLEVRARRENNPRVGRPTTTLRGKNGYKWSTRAPERSSDRFIQPVELVPGPAGPAVGLFTFEELWATLFPDEFFDILVEYTNLQMENEWLKMIEENVQQQTYHSYTDKVEMKAFVGLLYYSASWKSSIVNLTDLWSKESGLGIYRCTMSLLRYKFLLLCTRFDDKSTRDNANVFSPIEELWDKFISNCQNCYKMSNEATVDEQLIGFRGNCKFRMYMKSKPDKYGMKVVTLNDARTAYLYYGIPYLGKNSYVELLPGETKSEYFFRVVTAPIHNTPRTVTCDNWFTSIPLIERFSKEPYKLTITGTIRKNKKEIPAEMKVASKTIPDTKFCFSPNMTLLSHTPKKHKIVLLVSSFSKSTEVVEGKPQIILHYNQTKGGTDTFDQLCHAFTVSRKSNRWSMRFFYNILDQAAVNARILLQCAFRNIGNEKKLKLAAA